MCLIVFAYKSHPVYPLIIVANRDEAYDRPTRAAQFWKEHPDLLAGKDLKAGGSWMGVHTTGRFAALTNYRDPSINPEDPPSRGQLVLNYLTQPVAPRDYLTVLNRQADRHMGFNLIVGNPEQLFHYSNHEQKINRVKPGVHGLSNHLLDTPWPKVRRAKSDLEQIITTKPFDQEQLFKILLNDQPAPDSELPDTGIGKELERTISPVFIKSDQYGTRSSTIMLVDTQGKVTFEERRFKAGTRQLDEVNRYEFQVEG